jgi:hypothetical protein
MMIGALGAGQYYEATYGQRMARLWPRYRRICLAPLIVHPETLLRK